MFVNLVESVVLVSVVLVVECNRMGAVRLALEAFKAGAGTLEASQLCTNFLSPLFPNKVQWTTRITETGITNLTRITNEMATSSDYLMKYFNGILAVLLE